MSGNWISTLIQSIDIPCHEGPYSVFFVVCDKADSGLLGSSAVSGCASLLGCGAVSLGVQAQRTEWLWCHLED